MELTGKQKRHLRGLAHHLKPVVNVGKNGLGPTLIAQLEENLLAHELVKVKLLQNCNLEKSDCAETISEQTGAVVAQSLGRTLLFYRPNPDKPVIKLPRVKLV